MNTKTKNILIINRRPPYGCSAAQEGLDAVLIGSTFCPDISVLFLEDGVFQLLIEQNPQQLQLKNTAAKLSAFPIYEIKHLYVSKDCLEKRGLTKNNLCIQTSVITQQEISNLLTVQDVILNF